MRLLKRMFPHYEGPTMKIGERREHRKSASSRPKIIAMGKHTSRASMWCGSGIISSCMNANGGYLPDMVDAKA
jgi:hypothetical protein